MEVRLVRQADANERASRAFGAIDERRRRVRPRGCFPELLHQLKRVGNQRIVKLNCCPLATLSKVELAFRTLVPVVLQQQADGAYLDLLGHPRRAVLGWLASLHLNRHDPAVTLLNDVGLSDQTESVGTQLDGSCFLERRILDCAHSAAARIDHAVDIETLDRVLIVLEPGLHPLQKKEPRTVLELIYHPSRHEIRNVTHAARPRVEGRTCRIHPDCCGEPVTARPG